MLHKFNLCKSKLLCYNVDSSALASACINEQQIQIVDNDVHLGNCTSADISNKNSVKNVVT